MWHGARPFPHLVVDEAFPSSLITRVLEIFPPADAEGWVRFHNEKERKLGYRHGMPLHRDLELVLARLNSWRFIEWLEQATGIEGMIADPWYGGGGLHLIEPGGFLGMHADFNVHPKMKLNRRLNALLYLNPDWQDEWGGHLELWDRSDSPAAVKIAPLSNRLVVFETTDESLHGHPHPLTSPPGVVRRSLSLYFYTAPEPGEAREFHDTIFVTG